LSQYYTQNLQEFEKIVGTWKYIRGEK
jgi:hypothetical protein